MLARWLLAAALALRASAWAGLALGAGAWGCSDSGRRVLETRAARHLSYAPRSQTGGPTERSIAATATARRSDREVEGFATLDVPTGVRTLELAFEVRTVEPERDRRDDRWRVRVLTDDGTVLFDAAGDVGALPLVETYGVERRSPRRVQRLDVARWTGGVSRVRLQVFATNVGDCLLPTTVEAELAIDASRDVARAPMALRGD